MYMGQWGRAYRGSRVGGMLPAGSTVDRSMGSIDISRKGHIFSLEPEYSTRIIGTFYRYILE